jgi:nicotinate-nucleotide adenylyltransferase
MTAPVIIFGGTFDPPTVAHRTLPLMAAEAVGAHRIIHVPAAVSPHKVDQPPLDSIHRVAMLELALEGVVNAEIDRLELDRAGPSFAIDTVQTIRARIDETHPLRLLIGDDQAVAFHRWKDWDPIIAVAEPLVLPRVWPTPEAFADALRSEGVWTDEDIPCWCSWRLDLPIMEVDATEVRRRLAAGESVDGLIRPSVLEYIRENRLYGIAC